MIPLFYFDEKNHLILHPDCVRLCPELSLIKDKELLWIILAYDYYSPYHQFPERDRERRACWHVFDDDIVQDLKNKTSVKNAISKYLGLQWNPKIEYIRRYEVKIEKLLNLLDAEDSPSQIDKINKSIDSLRKTIIGLQNEVVVDVKNKAVVKGGVELSLLEQLQSNMKQYNQVLNTKPAKQNDTA
jgi:hypothetical protein